MDLTSTQEAVGPLPVLAPHTNHFQLPCPKTEVMTGSGYTPASANKFPVTWTVKQTAPAQGLGEPGPVKVAAYLIYAAR